MGIHGGATQIAESCNMNWTMSHYADHNPKLMAVKLATNQASINCRPRFFLNNWWTPNLSLWCFNVSFLFFLFCVTLNFDCTTWIMEKVH